MLKLSFRIVALALLVVSFSSCLRRPTYSATEQSGLDPTENREEKTASGETILIGPTTRVAFEKEPYSKWFHPNYLRYTPNPKLMEQLQPLLENVTVKAFIGTWCIDSHRELPRLFKVLEAARVPLSRLEIISLREDKTGLGGQEKTHTITAVPTFILFKNGQEVGRIVETAYPTLEMNMITILQGPEKK